VLLAALFALVVAADTPVIDAPVVDRGRVLAQRDVDDISATLRAHQARTGVQMAVLLIDTTAGVPIEDYALTVAEKWQGGARGRDDGILLVIAMRDRRMRLELGTGIEPWIPDSSAAVLIDAMKPNMRAGDVAGGVRVVVYGVMRATSDIVAGAPLGAPPFRLPAPLGLPQEQLVPSLIGVAGALATFFMRTRGQ
jgi:uncharacterized protein